MGTTVITIEDVRALEVKEEQEESILALLGIIGTFLNLFVIVFVYIYTTLWSAKAEHRGFLKTYHQIGFLHERLKWAIGRLLRNWHMLKKDIWHEHLPHREEEETGQTGWGWQQRSHIAKSQPWAGKITKGWNTQQEQGYAGTRVSRARRTLARPQPGLTPLWSDRKYTLSLGLLNSLERWAKQDLLFT